MIAFGRRLLEREGRGNETVRREKEERAGRHEGAREDDDMELHVLQLDNEMSGVC